MRLGRTAADERVATFLLQIARQTGADAVTPVEIDVPFGRLDIADHLGLTVETVSRELSKLKRDGLISMRSPTGFFSGAYVACAISPGWMSVNIAKMGHRSNRSALASVEIKA